MDTAGLFELHRTQTALWKECCNAFLCYEAQIPFLSKSSNILVMQDGTKLALRLRKKHEGLNTAGSIGRYVVLSTEAVLLEQL